MDDEMKAVDTSAGNRISSIMGEYNKDIENYNPPGKRGGNKDKSSTKPQENFLKLAQGSMANPGLDGQPVSYCTNFTQHDSTDSYFLNRTLMMAKWRRERGT
jgi:hypothetical protein